jgi:hypothetical protein
VEKNHELAEDDPNRKFKGRVVFLGNAVVDERGDVAFFQEMSSSPATLESAKAVMAHGLFPGHRVEQADAEQAYTQSKLGGTPTWIDLPWDALSEEEKKRFSHMRHPVCPLVLALYGHPDSGGYWERHCDAHLKKNGFESISQRPSCYHHPVFKTFLVVYVDDFLMSGPDEGRKRSWERIKSGINVGDVTELGTTSVAITR